MTAAQGKRRATPKVPGVVSQDPPAATSAEATQPAGQIVQHGDEGAPAIITNDTSGLPDQSEIDATTIARAVLTKQGWITPAPKPMPQNRY